VVTKDDNIVFVNKKLPDYKKDHSSSAAKEPKSWRHLIPYLKIVQAIRMLTRTRRFVSQ
jgi:hypothetical protein